MPQRKWVMSFILFALRTKHGHDWKTWRMLVCKSHRKEESQHLDHEEMQTIVHRQCNITTAVYPNDRKMRNVKDIASFEKQTR